jgi:hypothetical protein
VENKNGSVELGGNQITSSLDSKYILGIMEKIYGFRV